MDGSEPLYLRDFHDGTAADKVDKSALPKVRLDQESEVHVRFADFYRHSSGQAVGFLILRQTQFCLKTVPQSWGTIPPKPASPGLGCVSHFLTAETFSTDIHIHIQVSRG